MSIAARVRPRRALARVCALTCAIALVGALGFLPFAGTFLVREDALESADVMFVLAGSRAERWLEAVELYREGRAPVIVLSPGRMEAAELALRGRGIRLPSEADIARDAMLQLGVPSSAIVVLAGSHDKTAQEAAALERYIRDSTAERSIQRAIVVTSRYHTRRTQLAFRRAFDERLRIIVRASRFDASQPSRWWRHRADIRFVTSELPKVLLYALGLGG